MAWFIHWFHLFSPPPWFGRRASLSLVSQGSCLFSHQDNTRCWHLFPDPISHIVNTSCQRIVPHFARLCCQFHAMYCSMFCASWSCHGHKSGLTRVIVKGVGMQHPPKCWAGHPQSPHGHALTQSPHSHTAPTHSRSTHAWNTHNPPTRRIRTHKTQSHPHITHMLTPYTQMQARTSGDLTHFLFSPQDLVGTLARCFMLLPRGTGFYQEPESLSAWMIIRNILDTVKVTRRVQKFFFSFILGYF